MRANLTAEYDIPDIAVGAAAYERRPSERDLLMQNIGQKQGFRRDSRRSIRRYYFGYLD